eukprot:3520637-Pleurochrysis_carterae.AAC.2
MPRRAAAVDSRSGADVADQAASTGVQSYDKRKEVKSDARALQVERRIERDSVRREEKEFGMGSGGLAVRPFGGEDCVSKRPGSEQHASRLQAHDQQCCRGVLQVAIAHTERQLALMRERQVQMRQQRISKLLVEVGSPPSDMSSII